MRLKKYIVICMVWVACLGIVVVGKSESINYEIHFDTNTEETYTIKNEVFMRYGELVNGVHDESVISMVLHNIDIFAWSEDMSADWIQNSLVITIGDGQGTTIYGDLTANSICFPEVRPRSFLAELFD